MRMRQYDQLLQTLDRLRERTARFRRVALHVHSPDSHDWPKKTADKTLNCKADFLQVDGPSRFSNELRKHFDLVAITDHMRCSFASRTASATGADSSLIILPGMEVNFKPEAALSLKRLHLIVILPEGSGPQRFAELFPGQGFPDDERRCGNEEVSGISLVEWMKQVHSIGGLCIAAHVDGEAGARRHFCQTSRDVLKLFDLDAGAQDAKAPEVSGEVKEYLFEAGFDAIEIAKPADRRHYRWVSTKDGRTRSIPVVLTFDAHCIEEFNRPERITWVKATHLNLKGLRDALRFAETRVRFTSELPTPPSPRLLGIEIVGSSAALFENMHIAFAENLTCLIGPRGSGKSTVVEALRYVFGYNRTLDELDTANKLSDRVRALQCANLSGCMIRVVYQTQSQDVRVLEATFDPREDYATHVYAVEGDPVNVADVEASAEYPLRLFGWSEIETLGRDTARQRDLLDRLIPDIATVKHERDELRHRLRANRSEVETIINELQSLSGRQNALIRRYVEYKTAFEKLNTEDVKRHFAALDAAQARQGILELVNRNVAGLATKLKNLDVVSFREGLDDLLQAAEQDLRDWWLTVELSNLKLVDAEADVKKYLSAAVETLSSFSAVLDQHISAAKQEVEAVQVQLRAAFSDDSSMQRIADLRANAGKRLREVNALRHEYLKTWKRFRDGLTAREGLADTLVACHDRIAGIRSQHNARIEETLNRYFAGRMRITLQFTAGGDKRGFAEALVKQRIAASFVAQYQKRRIADILTGHFNPVTLVRALLSGESTQIAGKHLREDRSNQITTAEAQKAMESWKPWTRDELADVQILQEDGARLRTLMGMQEVEWDDEESILLNDRPVGELSPGQRSSAMLPLIALAETTPLVIDQPEDNLDNRLVGQVLTDILGALKEQRQTIVCTHNPNIVVSGDAEQVAVLEALSDRKATVLRHGSIDNDDIVQSVIEIMEGGEEAFRVRQQRYGF
jgi:DNA repair ATPase RecN/ABC-type dipeptide/oligopeptide/nickel transport system ATPase subunit